MDFFNNFDQHMSGYDFNNDEQGVHQDMGHSMGMEHGILNINEAASTDENNHGLIYIDNGNMHYDVGNANEMMNCSDPLIHSSKYHCAPLRLHDLDFSNPPLVHVDGYVKDDGTYVQEHFRTAPNGIKEDNLSYR